MKIEQGLQSKLDAIINRNLYTQYKSAGTDEEREKARIEYLDRRGIIPIGDGDILPYQQAF